MVTAPPAPTGSPMPPMPPMPPWLDELVGSASSSTLSLGVTLVAHAPWSFTTAWSIVKVFLDAKTAAKFKVLGTGAAGVEKLTKVLGEGKVPAFLGGTCVCAGGCVCCDPRVGETPDVLTTEQVQYARFAARRRRGIGDGEVAGSNTGGGAKAGG